MVIYIMKKYLFLLFLFFLYLTVVSLPKTASVLSYDDKQSGVVNVMISFDGGINSNDLKLFFDNYNKEYKVYNINVKDGDILVSCSDFDNCLKMVYELNNEDFETSYLVNGFMVNDVSFLAYKEEIDEYLYNKSFVYKTW